MTLQAKIEEMRKRCEAASPAPWRMIPTGMDKTSMATLDVIGSHNHTPYMSHANARFCANARSDMPALLSALEVALEGLKFYEAVENYNNYPVENRYAGKRLAKVDAILLGEAEK